MTRDDAIELVYEAMDNIQDMDTTLHMYARAAVDALTAAQEWQDISTAVAAERERCAAIVDAEAVFARENLDAIPDEAEADLGSRLTPRYYWNQRRALAEYYARFIRSGAPMVAEDGTLIADHRTGG